MTDVLTRETTAPPPDGELRYLTDVYMQVQKIRIGCGNRVYAAREGTDGGSPDAFVVSLEDKLAEIEKNIFGHMKNAVKEHPTYEWIDGVKGLGPTLSTKVLGMIGDISKFDTVSKLWSYSGYGLKDGKRQKKTRGEKLSYNVKLKTAVYLVGDSFIKSRSPYRDIYDDAKLKYRRERQIEPLCEILSIDEDELPDRTTTSGKTAWDKLIREANKAVRDSLDRAMFEVQEELDDLVDSEADRRTIKKRKDKLAGLKTERAAAEHDGSVWIDGHVDNASRRKMVKIFLSHLWEVWRKAEGLSTRPPYAMEYLNHTTYSDPWDFTSATEK